MSSLHQCFAYLQIIKMLHPQWLQLFTNFITLMDGCTVGAAVMSLGVSHALRSHSYGTKGNMLALLRMALCHYAILTLDAQSGNVLLN